MHLCYSPRVSTVIARLIAYIFVGVLYAAGPLLLLIAIGSSIPTARFVLASTAADGIIIEVQRVYLPRRSKDVYLPVLRFTANDGQTHMVRAKRNISFVRFKRGDQIRVRYIKDHPETARIATIPQLWMPQLILGIFGAMLTSLAVLIISAKRRAANAVCPRSSL